MQIGNDLTPINPVILDPDQSNRPGKPSHSLTGHSGKEVVMAKTVSSEKSVGAPDLKKTAREMITEPQVLGDFEDKKGTEQITDIQIGPDIQYALTSRNPDFVKVRAQGLVTIAEHRELTHRLRELEMRGSAADNTNIASGNIIDIVELNSPKVSDTQPRGQGTANRAQSILDIKV